MNRHPRHKSFLYSVLLILLAVAVSACSGLGGLAEPEHEGHREHAHRPAEEEEREVEGDERQAYRDDGARTRDEYVLTASGEELAPVLAALQAWGNRHLPNGMEPASRYVAADTREPLHIAFVDSNGCERDLDRIDVELLPLARSAS